MKLWNLLAFRFIEMNRTKAPIFNTLSSQMLQNFIKMCQVKVYNKEDLANLAHGGIINRIGIKFELNSVFKFQNKNARLTLKKQLTCL